MHAPVQPTYVYGGTGSTTRPAVAINIEPFLFGCMNHAVQPFYTCKTVQPRGSTTGSTTFHKRQVGNTEGGSTAVQPTVQPTVQPIKCNGSTGGSTSGSTAYAFWQFKTEKFCLNRTGRPRLNHHEIGSTGSNRFNASSPVIKR